jgi:uncharacterized protein
MNPRPLLFGTADTRPESGAPAAERVRRGDPRFATRNHYTDASGQFFSGEWSAGPGAWEVRYDAHEEEFCLLLEGEVVLTDADGQRTELKAGDAFVIPGGYVGTWDNRTPVRKLYAIMSLKEAST